MTVTPDALREILLKSGPRTWRPDARGLVFVARDGDEQKEVLSAIRAWAARDAFPLREPHSHVRPDELAVGPNSELEKSSGGILLLDPFLEFRKDALLRLGARVVTSKFPGAIIAIENLDDHADSELTMRKLQARASAVSTPPLSIVTIDDLQESAGGPASADVASALSAINLHRRQLGMRDLDPKGAGWSAEDIVLEAKRISRLANPLLDLKRRCLA